MSRRQDRRRALAAARLNAELDAALKEMAAFEAELDAITRAGKLHQTWPDEAEALAAAKRIYAAYGDAMDLPPDAIYRWITALPAA